MRIRRRLAMLPALAWMLAPSPAATQGRYVPMIRPPTVEVTVTGDDACPGGKVDDILVCGMLAMGPKQLKVLHHLSRCLVERRPQAARAMLADGYDAAADRPALRKLAEAGFGCGPDGALHVSGLLLAGALAEALVAPPGHAGDLDRRVALDPTRPPIRAHDESELMSLCAVRAAPRDAAAFFATEGGSKAEEGAVEALLPQLSACLGRDIRLVTNRPALRALLALAALRLALNNHATAREIEG